MRLALVAVSLLIFVLVFLPFSLAVVVAVLVAAVLLRRRHRNAADALALAWLGGGALLALGLVESAWRDDLSGAFLWLVAIGGVALAGSFVLLPIVVRGRGAWLASGGLALTIVGWAMAFFGGLLLIPVGLLLYLGGLVRAGLVGAGTAAATVAALVLAVLLAWAGAAAVLASEAAVLGALAVGIALVGRRRAVRRA